MADEYVVVSERLGREFADLPPSSVARVMTDCAQEYADGGSAFVEEAARMRLRAERRHRAARLGRWPPVPGQARTDELDLAARLILAAADAAGHMTEQQVDAVLVAQTEPGGHRDDAAPV